MNFPWTILRSCDQDAHIGPKLKPRRPSSTSSVSCLWDVLIFSPFTLSLSTKEYISEAWRFFWKATVLLCWYLDYFCCVLHPQDPKRSCRTKRRRRAPVRAHLTSISCLTSKRKQQNCAWSMFCKTRNQNKNRIKVYLFAQKNSCNQCNSPGVFYRLFFSDILTEQLLSWSWLIRKLDRIFTKGGKNFNCMQNQSRELPQTCVSQCVLTSDADEHFADGAKDYG